MNSKFIVLLTYLFGVIHLSFSDSKPKNQNQNGNRDPRFIRKFFGNFHSNYQGNYQELNKQEYSKLPPGGLCSEHDSTVFLEGKCLLLVKEKKPFEEATKDCENLEGELYRHHVENPFLFEYIYRFFPEYFDAPREILWTVFKTNDDGKLIDTSESDVLLPLNPVLQRQKEAFQPHKCIILEHTDGFLEADDVDCEEEFSYVCQFDSKNTTYVQELW